MEQLYPRLSAYNVVAAVRVPGGLDTARLREALALVVQRHESLRTAVVSDGSGPYQAVAERVEPPLETRVVDGALTARRCRRPRAAAAGAVRTGRGRRRLPGRRAAPRDRRPALGGRLPRGTGRRLRRVPARGRAAALRRPAGGPGGPRGRRRAGGAPRLLGGPAGRRPAHPRAALPGAPPGRDHLRGRRRRLHGGRGGRPAPGGGGAAHRGHSRRRGARGLHRRAHLVERTGRGRRRRPVVLPRRRPQRGRHRLPHRHPAGAGRRGVRGEFRRAGPPGLRHDDRCPRPRRRGLRADRPGAGPPPQPQPQPALPDLVQRPHARRSRPLVRRGPRRAGGAGHHRLPVRPRPVPAPGRRVGLPAPTGVRPGRLRRGDRTAPARPGRPAPA